MDPRERMFRGMRWYETLARPSDEREQSAWYVAHDADAEWDVCLLRAALLYSERAGLWELYRARFNGIVPSDLSSARATAENRMVSAPIWEIANELVVAAYLEFVLGWRRSQHEPPGASGRSGDWEFVTPSGRSVFVEVKTVREMPRITDGVYSKGSSAPRLQAILARGYKQLPQDERATLVVVVGDESMDAGFGLLHTGLFQALFGAFIVRFEVMTREQKVTYAGPSFHDMLIGHTKRRKLGVAAGLMIRGLFAPAPVFYAIHNPFAHSSARLSSEEFGGLWQFAWAAESGREQGTPGAPTAWAAIHSALKLDEVGCAAG